MSLPRRLLGGAPTFASCSPGTRSRRTCTRPAIGCPPESRRSPDETTTSSYSGSRAAAVVFGDALVDFGDGLEIPLMWLRENLTREQIAERLRPLLELPIEHVLATHGRPTNRAALERALS